MYDAFPNVAKKRKPSRQEVTDFAHLPTGDLSPISHSIESCFAKFCFLTLLSSRPKTVKSVFSTQSYSLFIDLLFCNIVQGASKI